MKTNNLRQDLHNLISLHDDLTVYAVIGTLEAVKMDLWDSVAQVPRDAEASEEKEE